MSLPPNRPVEYDDPRFPPAGFMLDPYAPRPRPFWKTWLFSVLLSIIPFVGSTIAVIYVYTRKQPQAFDGGEAFAASMIYLFNILLTVGIVAAIFAVAGNL